MLVLAFWFLWQTSFEVTKIDVQGLERFDAAGVLTSVDLKTGASAGKPQFDAACQRLIETGLFSGCNWKYMPVSSTGIVLTLQLKEAEAPQKVRLTVPGVDDGKLWEWLRANEPLVQPQMPGSDAAIEFYTRAIKRFLKQDVASSVNTNLETRENTLVFRPANVPSIASVKFTGAQAIDAATLEKTLNPLAQGTPFTEYDVRQLLDLNIRPMYENLGRLNVGFPSISQEGGVVTIQVTEGRVYTLAKAEVTGLPQGNPPKLPEGETAQWNRIVNAVESGAKSLRDDGYLDAKYSINRKLDDAPGTANIAVAYKPGARYTFRSLKLEGLGVAQEAAVRALWTLAAGTPMKESYVEEFLRRGFEKLGPEYSGVAHQFEPAGGNAVDVLVTFRRR